MGRNDDNGRAFPPKIKAAFDFLHHTRMITEPSSRCCDPMRSLTALEKSVEAAALARRAKYLLGEMDFCRGTPDAQAKKSDDDDQASDAVNSTTVRCILQTKHALAGYRPVGSVRFGRRREYHLVKNFLIECTVAARPDPAD